MNYRDRFAKTMQHKNVDRVPYDIGATPLTAFSPNYVEKLAKSCGIIATSQEDAQDQIMKKFDIDFRLVGDVLDVENDFCKRGSDWYIDGWGIKRKFTGLYYDIVEYPLKNATLEDVLAYPFPDASQISIKFLDELEEKAKRLYYDSDYVVVAGHPVFGVLELGCWMFGYDNFLLQCALDTDLVNAFFERIYKFQKDVIELYYGRLGKYIHLTTSGDDFGMQNAPMISPSFFAEHIVPWYKKRIDYTKTFTDAYYFHHSCGSVYRLMDSICHMGVDILNPIQPGAYEMEPERLKAGFGDKLTFWGGIDEQNVLTSGSAEDVKNHVKTVLSIMSNQGGYVLAPSHNVQTDVPVQNIVAMFEGANEYFGK